MDASPVRTAELEVAGMTCTGCEAHVADALAGVGAVDVSADHRRGLARIAWPEAVAEADLRAAVERAGYRPGALTVATGDGPAAAEGAAAEGAAAATRPAPAPPRPDGGAGAGFDLVVVGGGSAAFAAAIKATEAGARVALVERGTLGGTCVNVGCVPSKAMLAAAEAYWAAGHHGFPGIATAAGGVDLAAVVAAKDELVAGLRRQKYADLVEAYGFTLVPGEARFTGPDTLAVDGTPLPAGAVVLATGASPAVPPVPGLAEAGYLTSTTALELTEVPRRLAVIGANAIGLELGQLFLHLGASVTFLEMAERVAPFEEPEVSAALAAALADQGAVLLTGARVDAVERDGGTRRVRAHVGGADVVVEADAVLVATGRRPNTADLDLAAAGVATDARGAVVVDERLATTNSRVWAAGDVTGAPQFVYVAAYQGALAAENALGGDGRVDLTGLPRVIFTSPTVAGAGLTEAQARSAGHRVKTAVIGPEAIPRALVSRRRHGVVKLVADADTDRLLGASMVADGAGDAIQAAVLAIRHGTTTAELAATFHPYLTMAEGLKLAAQTFTRDVARLSCCAA
jgi:mercuric reductase